jgi:DNA-binding XRE family transcriptional regulator
LLQKLFLPFDNLNPMGYEQDVAIPQGPFYSEFGKRLGEARRAAKVTQEALAKSVGLSRTSIVNIEKGRQPAHLHLVAKIATSLGTSVSALVPDVALLAPVTMVPDLKKVSEQNRPFVERIISATAFKKGVNDAAKIFPGEAQSSRVNSSRKSKKDTGSSRTFGSHGRRKDSL